MPLFHGKKTVSFSATFPLLDDAGTRLQDRILYAVIHNQSIPAAVMEHNTASAFQGNIEAYYKYAKDDYTRGVPIGVTGRGEGTLVETDLIEILEDLVEEPVVLHDNLVTIMTPTIAMLDYLTDTRGFDLVTNRINTPAAEALPPTSNYDEVYLHAVHGTEDGLSAIITYVSFESIPEDFDWAADTLESPLYTFETIPIVNDLTLNNKYCVAWYSLVSTPTVKEWYFFDLTESSEYPSLVASYEEISSSNSYMPIVLLRYKNEDLTAGTRRDEPLFITSQKLLKKLGIDIDEVATQLNASDDIAELDHAFITHGVNLQDCSAQEIYYMCMLFDDIASKENLLYTREEYEADDPRQRIINRSYYNFGYNYWSGNLIEVEEYPFNYAINFNYIIAETHVGAIGPVDHATMSIQKEDDIFTDWDYDRDGLESIPSRDIYSLTLKAQLTEKTYREVFIMDLLHNNEVAHKAHVRTSLEDVLLNPALLPDESENPDVENNFVIPIHYGICHTLPKRISDEVFTNSLRLVLNGYERTSIPWYAQGWFQVVKMVIVLVITWLSWGSLTGPAVAAMEAGNVVLAALLLAKNILIGIAIGIAFKAIAKALGPEWAGIMAVVSVLIAFIAKNVNIGLNAVAGAVNMTTSQMFLQMSVALFKGASEIVQELISELQDDIIDFRAAADKQLEDLNKKVENLLGNDFGLDPLALVSAFDFEFMSEETPNQFYQRTIHTGNIGTLVLSTHHVFHDTMLSLPTPDQTHQFV